MKKIAFLLICVNFLQAQIVDSFFVEGKKLLVEQIASLNNVIWSIEFINQDKIIFSTRNGQMGICDINSSKVDYLKGVPKVYAKGQGGLLDLALDPKFEQNKTIYFTYSKPKSNHSVTALAKATLQNSSIENVQDIIETQSLSDTTRHFGSRITFDNDGFVYFGIGDRGHRPNGQDLTTHAGTILRLHLDGSIPKDNPFVSQDNALNEIYSYGHRNPQGLVYDQQRDILWEIEHGPRGGDEINIIQKGKNYGWATISHGKEYWGPLPVGEAKYKEGMQPAVVIYIPSIAPSSLMVYDGDQFRFFKGDLFAGALKLRHLNHIKLNKEGNVIEEVRYLEKLGERIRDVKQSPDGLIYFSTDSGKIFRIIPDN